MNGQSRFFRGGLIFGALAAMGFVENGMTYNDGAVMKSVRVHGPKPGVHRRKSQRRGVMNAHGNRLSAHDLRCLEIMGCDLVKAFPVEG